MARKLKINQRRKSAAAAGVKITPKHKPTSVFVGGNRMVRAANISYDRKWTPSLATDFHRNISACGRRALMTIGRWLYWNFPALQGAILEQANLAVSSFIPQSMAADKAWAQKAEDWLYEWHKIMDVAGWPYDYGTFLQCQVIQPMVDGDVFTLLTETDEGFPLIQLLPAHRIDCDLDTVRGGEYDGKRCVDGVITDDLGRALAYRTPLEGDNEFRDIPAKDIFPTFAPSSPGQVRGVSALASSALDWQDAAEIRRFELIAQKAFASQTIVEHNESGEADEASAIVTAGTFVSGARTSPDQQTLDGGTIRYFKAGMGAKLEAFDWDRPNQNAREFIDTIVRDAFRGAEMDSLFTLDPKSVGGAPMRVIVERLNAVLEKRRRQVEKACRRVDGYAISKAIKLGLLPENPDWWRWEYQGPGNVTADRKYDSDVDLQEIMQGIGTRKEAIARRGGYIEEVDEQRENEARSDLQRAQRLAKEFGITIQEALVVLRPPTASGQLPTPQQPAENEGPTP